MHSPLNDSRQWRLCSNGRKRHVSVFFSTRGFVLFLLIFALAIGVRLAGLGQEYLWYDEGCSYGLAECSLHTMMSYIKEDVHPPLFYLLLHYYVKILGEPTFFTLRLFTVFIDLIALFLVFQFTRTFVNDGAALIASLLYALSAFVVYYAQELRMYSLVLALSIASSYMLMLMIKRKSWAMWFIPYTLFNIAGIYTHYHFFFFVFSHGLFVFFFALTRKRWVFLRIWLLAFVLLFISYAFWIKYLMEQMTSERIEWLTKPHIMKLFILLFEEIPFYRPIGNFPLFIASVLFFLTLFVLLIVRLYKVRFFSQSTRIAALLQLFILCFPTLLVYLLSHIYRPIFFHRYLIFIVPAYIFLLATFIQSLKNKILRIAIISIILLPNIYFIYWETTTLTKSDWIKQFEIAQEQIDKKDLLAFQNPLIHRYFNEYTDRNVPYYNYKELERMYEAMLSGENEARSDVLIIAHAFICFDSLEDLKILSTFSGEEQTYSSHGIMLKRFTRVDLAPYFRYQAQVNERFKEFDYYVLPISDIFKGSFYYYEINREGVDFRRSKGTSGSFTIAPHLAAGEYKIVFDIDTDRPDEAPPDDLILFVNDKVIQSSPDIKGRKKLETIISLKKNQKVKVRFSVNPWTPMNYYEGSTDSRSIGFNLFSIGLKRCES